MIGLDIPGDTAGGKMDTAIRVIFFGNVQQKPGLGGHNGTSLAVSVRTD